MVRAALTLVLVVAVGCRKEKRDASESAGIVVSTGVLDTPPDSASLRQTPGSLPLPKGAVGGVSRATRPSAPMRSSTDVRTGEQVRRMDPPPESLKVAPAEPVIPPAQRSARARSEELPPARDTTARRDTIPR